MSNYTTGKWDVSTHADNNDIVIRSEKGIIANCSVDCWPEISLKEKMANAELIANAPEMNKQLGKFPNGFASWQETHFEITSSIALEAAKDSPKGIVKDRTENQGTGGLYELAEELTDKFENLNKGRQWDGEFFDEVENFLTKELKL